MLRKNNRRRLAAAEAQVTKSAANLEQNTTIAEAGKLTTENVRLRRKQNNFGQSMALAFAAEPRSHKH